MSEQEQGQQGEADKEPTAYDVVGGAARLKALVDRFYVLMDSEPEFAVIRRLHPADLAGSRDKLYLFLSGWLGGPPLYAEKYGHPMLRARHLPFAIGIARNGRPVFSTKARISCSAREYATPLPMMISGCSAVFSEIGRAHV